MALTYEQNLKSIYIMGKMKFIHQLMESEDFELFELAAYQAAEEGKDQFVYANGVYDVKFAASVVNYVYEKRAEKYEWEQRHLLGVPDTWPTNDFI